MIKHTYNYFAYSVATFFWICTVIVCWLYLCQSWNNCNRRHHCPVTHGLVLCMCIMELKGDGAAILS